MCGFAGIVTLDWRRPDAATLARMTDVIAHRGPDDSGYHVDGHVGFGFRRLSILDLSPSGHQPFPSADGRWMLVFNGEIFNYVELRRELQALGHTFRSTGDTEVLLHAWMQWGREALPRLNGMFAFMLHDRLTGTVFGARDRFGKKPLFRYRTADAVYFGSEIKSIRASGAYDAAPNWTHVSDLLCRAGGGANAPVNETFFAGIDRVPAGSGFEFRPDGTELTWRYWTLDERVEITGDPVEQFGALFEDAVRLRLRSDVPVGVSLSGGLDSSAIIGVIARLRAQSGATSPLKAFSFIDPSFDESAEIQANVRQAGAELHQVTATPREMWDRIDEVLWYHDEPMHSSTALVGFEVYRLAAQHGVKVVLGGQGADEAAAGYTPYFLDLWCTLVRQGRVAAAWEQIRAYSALHGGSAQARMRHAVARSARLGLRQLPVYQRAALRRQKSRDAVSFPWFSRDLVGALPEVQRAEDDGTLDGAQRVSLAYWPLPLYLRIEDRNSMAHSVEARLPFLDFRLVTFLLSLDPTWRLRGPYNKYVLRESMRGVIPELVRSRVEKFGFPVSTDAWFSGPVYEPMQDLLASQSVRERGVFDVARIRADLDRHRRGDLHVGKGLFQVAQTELWLQSLAAPASAPAGAAAAGASAVTESTTRVSGESSLVR